VTATDYDALRPDLLRLARALLAGSRVRLEAEDLVQGVLARLLTADTSGVQSLRHFAYAMLKNLFLDEVRRHSHRFEVLKDAPGDDVRTADPGHASIEVADLLARLAPHERCFVCKVCFEELSVHEAQKQCGWPPRSPYYQLRLLLERLGTLMNEEPRR
jgi:RNA polymerase sigma factor (sigma-70 family)